MQRAALATVALMERDFTLPGLNESIDELRAVLADPDTTVLIGIATEDSEHGRRGRILGAVRLTRRGNVGLLGRIVVVPDLRGRGIGSNLLQAVHMLAARTEGIEALELRAGVATAENLAIYRRHGYQAVSDDDHTEDGHVLRRSATRA